MNTHKPQFGDLILVKGSTPIISPLLRWFQNSEYTHVGIFVDENWIFEIDINKRMGMYVNVYDNYDVYRFREPLTEKQITNMRKAIAQRSMVNEGYDWFKIISFALEKFLIKIGVNLDGKNRKVCSEIVDHIFWDAGIDLVPHRQVGHARPVDIAESRNTYKVFSSSDLKPEGFMHKLFHKE